MAVKMKECKECGKLFTPKGRENYCSAVHYRPCPICGQPATVLYFSDPPRRCDSCKGKKNLKPMTTLQKMVAASATSQSVGPTSEQDIANLFASPKEKIDPIIQAIIDKSFPAVDMEKDELLNNEHVWTYVGKQFKNGFIPGHTYTIRLSNDRAAYILTSTEDLTTGESVNIYDRFSSCIMLNRNFVKSAPSS